MKRMDGLAIPESGVMEWKSVGQTHIDTQEWHDGPLCWEYPLSR